MIGSGARNLGLFLVVGLMVVTATAVHAQTPEAFSTHTSQLGYSVGLPSSWTARPTPAPTSPSIHADLNYASPDLQSFAYVTTDTSGLLTPMDVLNSYATDPSPNDWGYVASSPRPWPVTGAQSAYLMSSTSSYKGGTQWDDYDLAAAAAGALYDLHVSQTVVYATNHSSELSTILSSFRVGLSNVGAAASSAPATANSVAPTASASLPLGAASALPTSFGDGTYIVGSDIAPGTYRAPGGDSCYWARLSGFDGTIDDILANNDGQTRPTVTISASDAGFETSGCGTWTQAIPINR